MTRTASLAWAERPDAAHHPPLVRAFAGPPLPGRPPKGAAQ
ncbi:hypothetical protein AB0N81_03735 [Streptomyces sp. NPDC093510]